MDLFIFLSYKSDCCSVSDDLGCTLHDTIKSLVTWTEEHQEEIAAARAAYDRRAAAEATPV